MFDLVRLIREEVITIDDLSDFSEDLQDGVKFLSKDFRMTIGNILTQV